MVSGLWFSNFGLGVGMAARASTQSRNQASKQLK